MSLRAGDMVVGVGGLQFVCTAPWAPYPRDGHESLCSRVAGKYALLRLHNLFLPSRLRLLPGWESGFLSSLMGPFSIAVTEYC